MYIKRERYLQKIRPYYDVDLIKVLTGVRRCGKSILLEQIEEEFVSNGFDKTHIIRINFEDLQFEKIRTSEKLNNYIIKQIKDKDKYLIFLDEIQHVRSFEKVLASLRATINCDIFITGSNSKLLSGKMATLLVGRCVEFRIMPFSFAESYEYIKIIGKNQTPDEFIIDYINWGGFPLRFSFSKESDIKRYLEQTYFGILDKDIITDRSKINRQNFEKIAGYIMANAGKEFSSKNIENYFENQNGESLDRKTIYRYLDKMDKACLIDRVKRFNIVGKQAMSYIEKQYAVDTGFRMINTNLVNFEDTFFLENIIYNELVSRDYEVFTGKTYKGEIDFVVIDGRKKCFIQVAYYLGSRETIEREFGAFKPISDAAPKYVFSLDRFDYSRDGISHINIVDFLLGKVNISVS
ncbi:ATP-binding protein [Kineothrix sp. MSJ-39]|uniref:ATP-binding protein n=1 Tax=Kineothrix sp. MSJ-39 TaxID=2841533 RepID=UPI001C10C362|nr:ATP-binding protein [Kineothrix sp. MSJ-39]MBU5430230.1 ATP-binding protein [Kineothrix sp. MSJ-39]